MVGRLVDAGHQVRALGRSDEKRSAIGVSADPVDDIAAVCAGADALAAPTTPWPPCDRC
jgi:3-hydroxyisobutyrate dehydrogenase-like beta-hydroxyacid dehydrogenase